MQDSEFGTVKLHLKEMMDKRNMKLSKLAFRAEMQRTQLKHYLDEDMRRLDLSVLSRLCYALNCDLTDLLEYIPPSTEALITTDTETAVLSNADRKKEN